MQSSQAHLRPLRCTAWGGAPSSLGTEGHLLKRKEAGMNGQWVLGPLHSDGQNLLSSGVSRGRAEQSPITLTVSGRPWLCPLTFAHH